MRIHYIFFTLFLLHAGRLDAANYYLSASGDDAGTGLSPADPWRSLSKLNSISLQAGDSVFFAAGDTFAGQLYLSASGTATAPIYFGKYGNGSLPVISGTLPVNSWTPYAPFYYKTQVSLPEVPQQLFRNGQRLTRARYPNDGFLRFTGAFGDSAFSCNDLLQPDGFWNGAEVRFRMSSRRWYHATISAFSAAFTQLAEKAPANLQLNAAFYLDNHFSALDADGEWYYDAATGTLFLYSNTDPGTLHITASAVAFGFVLAGTANHLHLHQLHFSGQNTAAIMLEGFAGNIRISGCHFSNQYGYALYADFLNTNLTVDSCHFQDITGMAAALHQARHCAVRHSTFRRIGLFPGEGLRTDNAQSALEFAACDSLEVAFNQLDSIGSMGMYCGLNHSHIRNNVLQHTLLWTNELGAMYVYGTNEVNNILEQNIIVYTSGEAETQAFGAPEGAGIYLDGPLSGFALNGNVIVYATHGIRLSRGPVGCRLRSNTVYGCSQSQLFFEEGPLPGSTNDHQVVRNVLFALEPFSDVVRLISPYAGFLPAWMDSNAYFNPYRYDFLLRTTPPPGENFPRYFSLPLWQQQTGLDASSRTAFLYRTRYAPVSPLSDELITNGHFTANFDGWSNTAPGLMQMLLDNSTPLDFGCLKLAFPAGVTDTFAGIRNKPFPTDSAAFYSLRISTWSLKTGMMLMRLKNDVPPYLYITRLLPTPFGAGRMNCEFVFPAALGFEKTRLEIDLASDDSLTWLDNVSLQQVSVAEHRPEDHFRLFLNPTAQTVVFDLADTLFYDLNQQSVTQSLTVQPFSARILIYDSSLINHLTAAEAVSEMLVWPNPATAGQTIWISRSAAQTDVELMCYDLLARPRFRSYWPAGSTLLPVQLPAGLSSGFYILSCKENGRLQSQTLAIR